MGGASRPEGWGGLRGRKLGGHSSSIQPDNWKSKCDPRRHGWQWAVDVLCATEKPRARGGYHAVLIKSLRDSI